MKKILLVSHVCGFIPQFEERNVKYLQSIGYEVHYAANFELPHYINGAKKLDGMGMIHHHIPFTRSPFTFSLIKQYRALVRLMKEQRFDAVHCHTPVPAVLARIAAHKTKTAPVIYTAHGFSFYKGAPFVSGKAFYVAEKLCARYTDVLITINEEDRIASEEKLKPARTEFIRGVGVPRFEKAEESEIARVRAELGIEDGTPVILSVGELNKNKNHVTIVRALAQMKNRNAVYFVAGVGEEKEHILSVAAELGVSDRVRLLGYRDDCRILYSVADVYVMPSFREGLSLSLLEAMSSGCCAAVSDIRGNRDLTESGKGGYLFAPDDSSAAAEILDKLLSDRSLREEFGRYNAEKSALYSAESVSAEMKRIYDEVLR